MVIALERRGTPLVPRRTILAMVPVLLLIAGPGRIAAGQGGIGVVNAVGEAAIPAGAPIAVVAKEFTDLNSRLQEVVERALADRGFTVAPNAPLILSFDVEMSSETNDIEHRGGGNIVGSGEPGAEQPEIQEPQVKIPLDGDDGGDVGSRHSLSFTMGQDGRPPIWQGSVTATLPTSDPFEAAQAMTPVLAGYVGRNARSEQITID